MPQVNYNVFRILGDVSHTLSKCILIWAIHSNKSAEGVSLITQSLYALVFCSRYLDLLWTRPGFSYWNFTLKLFYIASSGYIVFLMMRVYARTREREKAWRLGGWSLLGSLLASPLVCLVFEGKSNWRIFESLYTFTLILEAFCILPQLLLLRQTTVPTVIDSFYLVTLGSYRFFYILNWILRAFKDPYLEPIYPISFTFGVIQTAFYFDFAWVYWSRQRVKLRGGGVVDGEDLSKGWLISRILGHKGVSDGDGDAAEREGLARRQEEGNGRLQVDARTEARGWGPRGISVSADEGVFEAGGEQHRDGRSGAKDDMTDPAAFEDDVDDDDMDEPLPSKVTPEVSNGEEWRDESR